MPGSGLVLSQVAPQCEHYVATDMSAVAIDNLRNSLERLQLPWRDRVELRAQPAHVTEGLQRGYFDTIIVNSVVQYFPNAGYLADLIETAMELLAPGGSLFIGDVRNHNLQGAFQTGIALARAPDADSAEIRQRVHHATLGEPELLLAPEFFTAWAADQTSVAGLDIRVKRGSGRQRTQSVSLRRRRPQISRAGALPGRRTHLGVGSMRQPARSA